jgi:hypothetical protein
MESAPAEVEVARTEVTVMAEVVAIRPVPVEFEVMKELAAKLVAPVPPYAMPMVEVPTMVPLALVVRMVEGIWNKVVEPIFDTENNVEVAVPAVEDAMAKSVVGEPEPFVEVAWMESCANGEEVPRPRREPVLLYSAFPV